MPPASDALQVSQNPPKTDAISLAGKDQPVPGIRRRGDDFALADCLEAVRRGEEQALRNVIKEYSALVYRVALGITQSEPDAEDVLQEVFIGLPEALHRFDGRNFAGWLKVVAKRRALMLIRSERRRHKYTILAGARGHGSLENHMLNKVMIEQALDRISPALRAVFLMREVEGLSHKEIANTMGITEVLSQVRLHRARRALRKLLT